MTTYAQPTPQCLTCGETGTVTLTASQVVKLASYLNGTIRLIQDAFPELSAEVREQIVTGSHPECWASHFAKTECTEDCDGSSHPGLWCK
jgi:hypothetical protein